MECICGYKGKAEFGNFVDEELGMKTHMRCPECRTSGHITSHPIDRIVASVRFPQYCSGFIHPENKARMEVKISKPSRGWCSYTITCPLCAVGEGGVIKEDTAKEITDLIIELKLGDKKQ